MDEITLSKLLIDAFSEYPSEALSMSEDQTVVQSIFRKKFGLVVYKQADRTSWEVWENAWSLFERHYESNNKSTTNRKNKK